jgi:tetratricopeptide (TPR) repeat protein
LTKNRDSGHDTYRMDDLDLGTLEQLIKSVDREKDAAKWGQLMNLKGVVLANLGKFQDSEKAFIEALKVSDGMLKSKILINSAKLYFLGKNTGRALELVARVLESANRDRKFPQELLGYSHLLRGQIYNVIKDEKQALSEFRKAEFYFEAAANPMGVGLSCLEVARIHIKKESMQTAWNFLKKSELFLGRLGVEKLGVCICKAVALYYRGDEQGALELLKEVYEERSDMGKGLHTIDEIIDAYLDTRSRMLQYQKALI